MANEISYRHDAVGATLYAVIWRSDWYAWYQGVQWEFNIEDADWADIAVPLAVRESYPGGIWPYYYVADFPGGNAGDYTIEIYEQAFASPASSDVLLAAGVLHWDGAAEVNQAVALARLDAAVTTRAAAATALTAQQVWEYASRTLSGFGSLVADVWGAVARTLTGGTKDAEIDAIKAKTDAMPADTAQELAAIKASADAAARPGDVEVTVDPQAPTAEQTAAAVWGAVARTLTGGTKDAEIDAIKARTDAMPADTAGELAAIKASADAAARPDDVQVTVDPQAPTAEVVAEAVEQTLAAAHGAGSWTSDGGAGATAATYTVTDSSSGLPLAGVNIVVTTDSPGAAVIARGVTDSLGRFTFYHDLAAGTAVYLWRQKTGYTFSNPDQEAIA